MNSILDRFAIPVSTTFRPKTAAEFLTLRIATKLNDAVASVHYASLLEQYSESQLLATFRRATRGGVHDNAGKRFHAELKNAYGNGFHEKDLNLISIRIERRSIAVAILYGDRLEYAQVRHLSSSKNKAIGSAVAFAEWVCDQFPLDSAAIEQVSAEDEIQRKALSVAVTQVLRARLLPIWDVPKCDLLQAYGYPRLKSRRELREVITGIWPSLEGTNSKVFIQDAVALGLYVQTERLFIIN